LDPKGINQMGQKQTTDQTATENQELPGEAEKAHAREADVCFRACLCLCHRGDRETHRQGEGPMRATLRSIQTPRARVPCMPAGRAGLADGNLDGSLQILIHAKSCCLPDSSGENVRRPRPGETISRPTPPTANHMPIPQVRS
jgi:hypothetical protein